MVRHNKMPAITMSFAFDQVHKPQCDDNDLNDEMMMMMTMIMQTYKADPNLRMLSAFKM